MTDFLSRVGVKGEVVVSDSLTAFYRGEWDVDIEDDADFGDARLGYVGIQGKAGRLAIGKQWSPHFNIVAEVTDIFNHRSSPFGYDEASPFRSRQILTYAYSQGGFRLDSGIQFDGDPENGAGGSNTNASEPDHIDSASLGIGYGMGDFYAGISYLDQQGGERLRTLLSGSGCQLEYDGLIFIWQSPIRILKRTALGRMWRGGMRTGLS